MSGHKNGVAAIIKKDEPRALFTHCYGHALNLAASDAVMQCGHMKDSLDTVYEITKLVKFSPKREAQLRKIKADFGNDSDEKDAPNIRVLCPTIGGQFKLRHFVASWRTANSMGRSSR